MLITTHRHILKVSIAVVMLGIIAAMLIFHMSMQAPFTLLLIPISFLAFLLASKCPELLFALFVSAGAFQADERLAFVTQYINLTLAFEVLTIVGLVHHLATGKVKFYLPPVSLLAPYLALALLGLISLSYTPAHIYGTDKALRFIFITTFAFLAPQILFQNIRAFQLFFVVFIVLSIAMICDSISNSGYATLGNELQVALGSSHIVIGRVCGLSAIALFFFFFDVVSRKSTKVLVVVLGLVVLFELLSSGGRGPIAALVISVISVLLVVPIKSIITFSIKKHDLVLLKTLLFMCVISVVILFSFQDHFRTTYARFLEIGPPTKVGSNEARATLYSQAYNAIVDKKQALLGLGFGGFNAYSSATDAKRGIYPHNIFLEFGVELGLAGLIIFTLFIFQSLKIAFTNIFNSPMEPFFFLNVALLAGLIFMVINASVSGDINDNRLLFAIIGLIAASRRSVAVRWRSESDK